MEYRDQGYAGKSVPAEWLVLGPPQGCETLERPSIDSAARIARKGTARYPCDILQGVQPRLASLEMLIIRC